MTQDSRIDYWRTWAEGLRSKSADMSEQPGRRETMLYMADHWDWMADQLEAVRPMRSEQAEPVDDGSSRAMMLESSLTCPQCGATRTETMPEQACQFFYECTGCHAVLRPLPGDCCVFCSYGSMPCPPVQEKRAVVPD